MPYTSSDKEIIKDTLAQIEDAIDQIIVWSAGISCSDDYLTSTEGMKTLAATCMLLEAIGEGVKKIDRRTNGTLLTPVCPSIPWKDIAGMRDHIAHGYFQIDAELVFDVVTYNLVPLKEAVIELRTSPVLE